jgi:predicted phosphate transport protein (TIGR00153 family)
VVPLTFPLETEATARRRILNICQDNARVLVEIVRKLALMIDSLSTGDNDKVKDQYKEILAIREQSNKLKATLLGEVASLGSLLISREDFLRLTFRLAEITDTAEGVGFRLASTIERKISIDRKIMSEISRLATLILDEVTRMKETLMALTFNPSKAIEMASSVEEIERKIDSTYRTLDIEILTSKGEISKILVMKDVVERLESMADLTIDALDQIRVLAITG